MDIVLFLEVIDRTTGQVVFIFEVDGVDGWTEITSEYFSLPDGDYRWRITTTPNWDLINTYESDYVDFTIVTPPEVSNISPSGYLNKSQPLFTLDYSDPNSYLLDDSVIEIAYDKDFNYRGGLSSFYGGKQTSFTIPYALKDGTYYYRVRVTNEMGISSSWSEVHSFSVNTKKLATYEVKVGSALPSDSTVYIPVIVTNTGTETIKKDEADLSYRFYRFNGSTNKFDVIASFNPKKTELPFDLPVGQSALVNIEVVTPNLVDTLKLLVELKVRGGDWFSSFKSKVFEKQITLDDRYNATYYGRAPPVITTQNSTSCSLPKTVENTGK